MRRVWFKKEMKSNVFCPVCGWKPPKGDVRLLGFHMECHGYPFSAVINVLKRMGLESKLYQCGILGKSDR